MCFGAHSDRTKPPSPQSEAIESGPAERSWSKRQAPIISRPCGIAQDILFLGDLVTSRDHVGRLKKRMDRDLHDEWFVITNISALPGRPVGLGIGAIVHCF